jgi:tetratricopeptide (TPR) repeat protein
MAQAAYAGIAMIELPEPLFVALFAAVFVMFVVVGHLYRSFAALLRERHPKILERIKAEDERSGADHDDSSPAMLSFVWRRHYRRLRDEEVTRAGDRIRVLLIPTFAGFAVLFVAMLYRTYSEDEAGETPPKNPAHSIQALRDRALTLHHEGRIEEAIRVYDEILGPIGADGELVYWRGVAQWKAGREDQALVDFRRVMDLTPGRFDAYMNADRILSRQRRFDDCVDLWTRYLRVVPGDATAHMERGGSHFHRGDFASAHADAQRACDLGKKEACGFAERARARM